MSLDIPVDSDLPEYTLPRTGNSGSHSLSNFLDNPLSDVAIPPLTFEQDCITFSSNGPLTRDLARVDAGFSPLLSLEPASQLSDLRLDLPDTLSEFFENLTPSSIDLERAKQLEQLEILKIHQSQIQEHIESL